ncbi:MAG: ABC transporter ATP-binding protein [Kiloniellales bacterium]|nr:ABC transporter ATP-binding protein [Kiloniellales bacterium]
MLAFFENLIDPFPAAVPDKPPRRLFGFIAHYTRPIALHLVLVALTAAAFGIMEVALFGFLGNLVDFLAGADPVTFWSDHFWWLLGVGLLVLVVMPCTELLHEGLTNQGIMGNFPMRIRWLAHRYVLRQSMSFFQEDFAGRVATKVMQTALAVREVVALTTEVFVYVGVYFLGALVLFAQNDWRLMAPLALWALAYAATMRFFIPRMKQVAKEQADARSDVTGRIVDSYTNIQTVKLFAHAAREEGYVRDSMTPFMDTVHRQFRLVTWLNLTLEILNGALLVAIGLIGIWLWTAEAVTAGAVALAVGLVLRLKGMSHWVMWEMASLFENIGTVQDGLETIANEHDLVDRPAAPALAIGDGAIAFEHVRFHYGKEGGVLDDLSLSIAPGEKIGLVGPSGAGKSTVVNLLLRFYDTEAGQILIDSQDIAGVTQESLRAAIGLVSQDTSLLHRSVRDNIRYGRPDATEAEIMAAVEAAKAASFVPDLADRAGRRGLDAHVGERGVKLSGGQRQRIAIARVILKDAPILVLDEATSALDSEVEAAIQDSLTGLMAGKTVIAIAHRLSTIAAMDRLIVMDRGRIVEQGGHEELLAAGGLYARLWARQSGGFLDAGPGEQGRVGLAPALPDQAVAE